MDCNLLVGQSGGPTAAINASLAGVVRAAMANPAVGRAYGTCNGLEGFLQGRVVDMAESLREAEDFERLRTTPAMALGSCRFKLPAPPAPIYEKVLRLFRQYGIGYFLYIGGNDSMDTVQKLAAYCAGQGVPVRCVGIPKTIDNDLPCIDHSPGYGSAARFIATAVTEIACDSSVYHVPSVTIVEIMGRNAGWLTASSVLARRGGRGAPHLIYLPERPFDPEEFLRTACERMRTEEHLVVAVSEGLRRADESYVSTNPHAAVDSFGHSALAGVGKYLEGLVRQRLGCKVRAVELNVLQRAAGHLASATDLAEAERLGAFAVQTACEGRSGVMVTLRRLSEHPYLTGTGFVPLEQIANRERKVPAEWITASGCDVTDEMTAYVRPLVRGEARPFWRDGLPDPFWIPRNYVKPDGEDAAAR